LSVVQKGLCSMDICTEADLRMQKTISYNLKHLYPKAKVICEEDDQELPKDIRASV
jgi:fructose-1,6-bisphosphatase/inositol monophosphatase family enzyme